MAILKSSDNNWYQLRVALSGGFYFLEIDQSSSAAPTPAFPEYWVFKNTANGLNYKGYLDTTDGITALNIEQVDVAEYGTPYILLNCSDDSTNHKISVVSDGPTHTYELNLDNTVEIAIPGISRIQRNSTYSISGLSRIQNTYRQTMTGVSRITSNTKATIQGVGRIMATLTSSIGGVARIGTVGTTVVQITGVSRIFNTNTLTISGVARISVSSGITLSGISRIQRIGSTTQSGTAKIVQGSSTATISGTARIRGRGRYKYNVSIMHDFVNKNGIL